MKPSKLETKFRKEIQILAEQISEAKPLAGSRAAKFFECVFPSDGMELKTLKLFAAAGLCAEPDETIEFIILPRSDNTLGLSRSGHIIGLKIEGDRVVITTKATVRRTTVEQEPVMEWVEIDKETRKLKQALDKEQKPKFKEKRTVSDTQEIFVFQFPVKVFVDVLIEVDLTSIIEPPPLDYIPKELGSETLYDLFVGLKAMFGYDTSFDDQSWFIEHGGRGFSHSPRRHSAPHPGGPYMGHSSAHYHGTPMRVFLQPEKGTKRVEVVVEHYTKEEVRKNRDLIQSRTRWAALDVFSTRTIATFLNGVIPTASL